jgi:hypothetical protein
MNHETYRFIGYMDVVVSQSIERRKGWHQKLTKNPELKKKVTLQSCIRQQPPMLP